MSAIHRSPGRANTITPFLGAANQMSSDCIHKDTESKLEFKDCILEYRFTESSWYWLLTDMRKNRTRLRTDLQTGLASCKCSFLKLVLWHYITIGMILGKFVSYSVCWVKDSTQQVKYFSSARKTRKISSSYGLTLDPDANIGMKKVSEHKLPNFIHPLLSSTRINYVKCRCGCEELLDIWSEHRSLISGVKEFTWYRDKISQLKCEMSNHWWWTKFMKKCMRIDIPFQILASWLLHYPPSYPLFLDAS